jgi:hypothetical protein
VEHDRRAVRVAQDVDRRPQAVPVQICPHFNNEEANLSTTFAVNVQTFYDYHDYYQTKTVFSYCTFEELEKHLLCLNKKVFLFSFTIIIN